MSPLIALAPMEGLLDPILREILTAVGGLDRAATEFVRVTDRLLPEHVLYRYSPELRTGGQTRAGVPVFVQFLGGQPSPLAENAAQAAALGAPGIDLNFGCPAKTVNRHDGGATLLKDPARVYAVTAAVRAAVPGHLPVTAKVRLGFDHKDFTVEIAQAAEQGGASALTVHARTKMEMYQPPAHWEFIAGMREAVSIPVLANGDIWSVEDYVRCREISGCSAVALGRGLVSRPDLAQQIRFPLRKPLAWSQIRPLVVELFQASRTQSERLAGPRTKQWCKLLTRNYSEALDLFKRIKALQTPDLILNELLREDPWPLSSSTPGPSALIV